MRNPLYNNDFENFLQKQVNQHRMYPPDYIWRNIQEHLHGYKRWPALGAITIFVISALVIGTVLTKPHKQINSPSPENTVIPASVYKPGYINEATNEQSLKAIEEHLSVNQLTKQTIAAAIEKVNHLQQTNNLLAGAGIANVPNIILTSNLHEQKNDIDKISAGAVTKEETALADEILNSEIRLPNSIFNPPPTNNLILFSLRNFNIQQRNTIEINLSDKDFSSIHVPSAASQKIKKSLPRFDFQFYLTPSVSYRKLADDMHGKMIKSYISAIPYDANYRIDINQAVRHRPAIGYEVGAALGYKLSEKLSLRSGFQFNVRQYNIDAFAYSSEPASITLFSDDMTDTINTLSAFRNVPGSNPVTLKNRYYELSMPIGIDWRPVIMGKISWGIAASVQPTYIFDKEPFIITSNLKNYADGSLLMRNWNVNTNIETYFGYTIGKYRWQIGPQFRYQLLPTLNNKYPIREHLLDYGLKVGFIKALK